MSLPEGEEERGLAAAFPRCGAGEKLGLILPKPPAHGGRLAALQPLLGQGWPRTPPVSREHRALGSEALEIQALRGIASSMKIIRAQGPSESPAPGAPRSQIRLLTPDWGPSGAGKPGGKTPGASGWGSADFGRARTGLPSASMRASVVCLRPNTRRAEGVGDVNK